VSGKRFNRMSRHVVAALASVLVLTGCMSAQQPTQTETEPEETAQPAGADAPEDGPVQDTWVYERIQAVQGERFINITDEIVGGLKTQNDGVDLPGGVSFYPLSTPAHIADPAGNVREDLDVVAGVVEADDVAKLQVIATPTEDTSVGADDVVVVDFSFLDLPEGTPLIADFAFGQGIPTQGEDPELTGVELLVERMENDQFDWFGVEDDGDIAPGLLTTLGSLPSAEGVEETTRGEQGSTRDALWREESTIVSVDNGGGGGMPAKARPTTDSLGELGKCRTPSLKCISDYFKEMTKGFEKSLDLLFNRNMPSPPPPEPPGCPPPCGGGRGEPHMVTFDQHAYDLQLVGEFVLAQSDDVTVQIRTSPFGGSDEVSAITGVAIEAFGERFTFDTDRDDVVLHGGEAAQRPLDIDVGQVEVYEHGGVAELSAPDGVRVVITRLDSRNFDVWVDPGTRDDWQGLIGSPDGDRDNDLTTRDGEVIPLDTTGFDLYETFGDSWRISDSQSLFDYGPGQDTATFTDLDFPARHLTIDDLDPEKVAMAEAICEFAGISEPHLLDACIYDYAVTGDMSFVTASLFSESHFTMQSGSEWLSAIPGLEGAFQDPVFDGHGQVLVTGKEPSGPHWLTALDLTNGTEVWSVPLGWNPCVAVDDQGEIFVRYSDPDGQEIFASMDSTDGSVVEEVEVSDPACDHAMSVGETMVFQSGSELHLYTGLDDATVVEVDGLIGHPTVSEDGELWAVGMVDDTQGWAYQVDPESGDVNGDEIWVDPYGNITGRSSGFAAGFTGDDEGIFRYTTPDSSHDSGVLITPLPFIFGDEEYDHSPSGPLVYEGGFLATYVDGETVGVFDADTGEPLRRIKPSSFENNKRQIALVDGLVTVGPFGGNAWVEMYDVETGELAREYSPEDSEELPGLGDVRRINSTPDGQAIVQANYDEGVVVAVVSGSD